MKSYYINYFPYEWVEWFLTCGKTFPLNRRELVFRWGEKDITKRHETFKTLQDSAMYMERNGYEMTEEPLLALPLRFGTMDALRTFLIAKMPNCIDAGPIFQSLHYQDMDRKDEYAPKLAPLTYDIDLKGYAKRGNQCECYATPKGICDQCWIQYLRPALVDLVHFLRDIMQFKTVIPVFSGRGGFHVYVLDKRVWTWDDTARSILTEHLPDSIIRDTAITLSHLIKIPFSPHKNGYLSMPILNIYEFLPSRDRVKLSDVTDELINKLTA
jgi:DNA primase catalytic subunit